MKFNLVGQPTKIEMVASADGNLLLFEGAILARAEVNKNRDRILPEGIDQLAATIAGRAIDVEHNLADNCGIFTAGLAVDDPTLGRILSTSGLIWADRYPEIAAGIQAGTHGMSVEADGKYATCSICSGKFDSSEMYCKHLRNRRESGAERTVVDLTSAGGAVTRRPAGNGTDFSQAAIRFVASHEETKDPPIPQPPEVRMKNCPYCNAAVADGICSAEAKHVLTADALAPDLAAALAKLQTLGQSVAELETAKSELAAKITEGTAALAAKDEALTAEQAKTEAAKTELTAAQATVQIATAQLRRQKLAGMTDEQWEKRKPTLLAMDDAAFDLTVELATAPAAPGGIRLDAESEQTETPAHVQIELA